MKIAIIGAGNVGRALGGAWRIGHRITYGLRAPDSPKYADLAAPAAANDAAVAGSEIVVLCTPWHATEEAVKSCGDLAGKVLIDCTNPLTPDFSELEIGHTTSGAEQIAAWAPGAHVCKAMNQIGAPMMNHPQLPSVPVMVICGDDEDAKEITSGLVSELGFETVDLGDLTMARLLEPYGLIWIQLALRRGLGTDFAFGLLRRR
jgi:8-hydroxy-5-deazaflavin:NADPH oxidoreductase